MPPFVMNIVYQKWSFLNATKRFVPKQISKLYDFGLQVLTARFVVSLRANARLLPLNWHTAKSKMYRLLGNGKISLLFLDLLKSLCLVGEKDIVVVDFSDFGNGFQVLMFAKQTKRGRAIPLYFEILRYPIDEGSQNIFVIQAIKNFSHFLGFKPKLVFDRGFACPYIVKFMARNKYIFLIRIKKKKSAQDIKTMQMFLVKDSEKKDRMVWMYSKRLRLIISDQTKGSSEPWYLMTNDFKSSRQTIIDLYYHRFEIEEFFRDAKRLLNLEHVNFQKEISLRNSLWFVLLGVWFFQSLDEQMDENDEKARKTLRLSAIRYFFEKMYQECLIVVEGEFIGLNPSQNGT